VIRSRHAATMTFMPARNGTINGSNERDTNARRSVYLETFGCQMNELDSELVRGHLTALGYRFTRDPRAADIVLYNTCSVREQAENKALSRVGRIGIHKREGRKVILGVIGCMAEREGAGMMRKYPQIDLMCGPGELDKLPMLIDNACKTDAIELVDRVALQGSNARRSSTLQAAEDNLEMLDLSRAFDPDHAEAGGRSAYVRITRGCNKFCTYCVVPHTRGPEVHRPPDSIVEECRMLADHGVIEVTLLGQTVNHYRYTHGAAVTVDGREMPQVGPGLGAFKRKDVKKHATNGSSHANGSALATSHRTTSFADLLHRIHEEVPAIQRLRFVTSYPRDFTDDALEVMSACPRICRYLHVPAQSGSNRILKLMNRGYTREEYVEFIHRARAYMPDVAIAGDIIVGFPTETDDDFEETKSLLREVRFKNNFIFKYSPRPGTVAIDRFADDVPDEVKRERNNELLALQAGISEEVHREQIGRTVDVFVERVSKLSQSRSKAQMQTGSVALTVSAKSADSSLWESEAEGTPTPALPQRIQLSGRTGGDLITVFELPSSASPDALIGRIVPVEITDAGPLLLRGRLGSAII
jgi:tRNA-2-methylthio-N6-dimethylallyladenosine synthase